MNEFANVYKYVAFISYQRKDEEWAQWFHHQLEHYHLPTDIDCEESVSENGSLSNQITELRPMFLDDAELAGGNLVDSLDSSLNNSRFLIVLCSPNSAKSEWVNLEVQTFIDNGRISSIIPVIIDGTPYSDDCEVECFVPALKKLKGTNRELLGISAKAGKEMASVKIVAQILGVSFDSLWNRYEREKEQERKKLIEERRKLQCLESRYLAEKGRVATSNDNNLLAIKLALRALPEDIYNIEDRPFVDEASDMLYHALQSNNTIIKQDISGIVFDAAFNPFSNIVAACGDAINLWDVATGRKIKEIPCKYKKHICYSPDGKKILATGHKDLYLYDIENNTGIKSEHQESALCYAEFNHNGTLIAKVCQNEIILYDAESLNELRRCTGHTDWVMCVAFTSDGLGLISGCRDKTLKIWNIATGECVSTSELEDIPMSIAIRGTKMLVAYAGGYIMLLDFSIDTQPKVFAGHSDVVKSAKFSHDAKMIISVSADKTIKLWDVETCECMKTITHDLCKYAMQCASLSPMGRYIVSSDSVMKITDLYGEDYLGLRNQIIDTENFSAPNIAFSSDAKNLFYCTRTRDSNAIEYYKWDLANDQAEKYCINADRPSIDTSNSVIQSIAGMVYDIYMTPDNRYMLMDIYSDDMYVIEISSGKLIKTINIGGETHRKIFQGGKPGELLVRVGGELYLFDTITFESTKLLNIDDYMMNDQLDISADNKGNIYIMESSISLFDPKDITVFVYNIATKKMIKTFKHPRSEDVSDNSSSIFCPRVLSPDGKFLLLNNKLWDIESETYVINLDTYDRKIRSATFSPDGKYLLTSCDDYATLWDLKTGQYFYSISHEIKNDCRVIFSPDGSKCAFSTRDGHIKVWDFIPPQHLIDKVRKQYAGVELSASEKRALHLE